jgi:RNAse (barnase) inhibitor barstar
MTTWIDIGASIPWVPLTQPRLVSQDVEQALVHDLEGVGFRVAFVEGSRIVDEGTFFAHVAAALGFPDYFGRNWDAFHDCFGDLRHMSTVPLAIVWRNASVVLEKNWPTLFRATHEILNAASGAGSMGDINTAPLQIELFLLGRGPGFEAHPP